MQSYPSPQSASPHTGPSIPHSAIPNFGGRIPDGTISVPSQAPWGINRIPTPREMVAFLDTYVVGQSQAKRILSVGVHNHYKRVAHDIDRQRASAIAAAVQRGLPAGPGGLPGRPPYMGPLRESDHYVDAMPHSSDDASVSCRNR